MMINKYILTPLFLDKFDEGLQALTESDWLVNNPELPEGELQQRISVCLQGLSDGVFETINRGERPVSIAGDCCTTIGVMAGLQRAGIHPTLLWLDAHGDFNTWETSPSGFLGGMPLAMLTGLGDQTMPGAVGLTSLADEQVVLTDGRDLDDGERDLINQSGITHFTDINGLKEYAFPDRPLYIHFDTDLLDPAEASAMGYLAPGGPSSMDLKPIFHHLAQTNEIIAVSMSTWRPAMDADGSSQKVCMGLLRGLLGDN